MMPIKITKEEELVLKTSLFIIFIEYNIEFYEYWWFKSELKIENVIIAYKWYFTYKDKRRVITAMITEKERKFFSDYSEI